MPYFPKASEQPAYRCPGCGGLFVASNVSCLVAHAPGTCCHEYERRVDSGPAFDPCGPYHSPNDGTTGGAHAR